MSVHEDIIDTYKRTTNVQAMAVGATPPFPDTVVHAHSAGVDGKLSIVPGRVYILLLNNTILGCFAVRDRAFDEAHALMHHYGGTWHALSDQIWSDDRNRLITVSAHDVR